MTTKTIKKRTVKKRRMKKVTWTETLKYLKTQNLGFFVAASLPKCYF